MTAGLLELSESPAELSVQSLGISDPGVPSLEGEKWEPCGAGAESGTAGPGTSQVAEEGAATD